MALTYRSNQAYRNTFTYQGSGSVGPVPPTPTPPGRKHRGGAGGGVPTIVRIKSNKPVVEEPKPLVPVLTPMSLRSQYDALLETGEINTEEWAALLMLHGVNPARMVSV